MSKEELRAISDRVVELAGGPVVLGRALGISRQAVRQWRCIPVRHIATIERLVGVSRYEMRHDVFGDPPLKAQPKPREEAAA